MKYSILPLLVILFLVSCSNNTSKTSAKLKLNLSGITNVTSGIGAGGTLLFGKSSTGEQFGKIISASEQELDLPNGDWSFYAVMWTKTGSFNFNDTIYCGKSTSKLSGTAVSVALNLTNATCADADFSAGKSYTDTYGKIHMPNFLLEECDDVNASNSIACKKDNEGSALSYRMTFRSYKKAANGAVIFDADSLSSACATVSGGSTIFSNGMYINFPVSSQAMPFIMSAEMFLGSTDCGISNVETKGVYTQTFFNGLNSDTSAVSKKIDSTGYMCAYSTYIESECVENSGTWTGSTCQFSDIFTAYFVPAANCSSPTASSVKYVKQMVSIPKEFLCRNLEFNLVGIDSFPGGNGSVKRPYKICNEWQLNQIGEIYATSSMLSGSSYKLMNDLDMNVTDFNPMAKPLCVGEAGSLVQRHHNLNPLDQMFVGGCLAANVNTTNAFSGNFNGNNKTISNGRIYSDIDKNGFVRRLAAGGVIRNLNFKNLEVEGVSHVGLIAGDTESTALIDNVKIKGGHAETDGLYAGGAVGELSYTSTVKNVLLTDVSVRGLGLVGGLVGKNSGEILSSMFRGEVKQYSSLNEQVGGLVGMASSTSTIKSSFTEGHILSYAKNTGGIAGLNSGYIQDSYSTMFILSKYGDTSAFIGGIAGSNSAGTIASVYFDGVLKYDGGASGSTIDGVAAYGGTQSSCFSSSNNVSTSSCSFQGNMRTGSLFSANSVWFANVVGALPRLLWEQHSGSRPCLLPAYNMTIAEQKNAGKGTAANPLTICTPTQLIQFGVTGTNLNAVIKEDLNLSLWTISNLIPYNTQTLDGQNHSIMGLTVNATTADPIALILNNTGKIVNLNMYGNEVNSEVTGATTALLSAVNSGSINGIRMSGNSVYGFTYVGLISGSQSSAGKIDDIVIEDSKVKGGIYVGSVAGNNEGLISRAYIQTSISENPSVANYHKIGGVSGFNSSTGIIDQISFGGNINFSAASSNADIFTGGLIGYNLGTLKNSLVRNYSQINVKNPTSVGGLIGTNTGTGKLLTSFSTGKLIYNFGVVPTGSNFHQLIGYNDGSISYSYYLEKKAAGFLGGVAATSACTGSSADFSTAMPAYLTLATPDANLMSVSNVYSSGDSLDTLSSFSLSSNYVLAYTGSCAAGDVFNFYQEFEPYIQGKKTIADFGSLSTFADYDIAYDDGPTSGNSVNYERLMDYHKSKMNGVAPTLIPPIWQFEPGEYPRLVQLND